MLFSPADETQICQDTCASTAFPGFDMPFATTAQGYSTNAQSAQRDCTWQGADILVKVFVYPQGGGGVRASWTVSV